MLVASTDSAITIYRVREWVLLRQLKGHKGRVNSIDAHPAGRVALSVGQDKMLRMWDLVAGKAVATLKIGEGKLFDKKNVVYFFFLVERLLILCLFVFL